MERRQLLSAGPTSVSLLSTITAHTNVVLQHGKSASPAASNTVPVGALSPQQIRNAYGINAISLPNVSAANGSGQTIAIIDAYSDPNALADLKVFDAQFGLPDPLSFTQVNQNGGTALPAVDTSAKPNTWELEESLDLQWAHAIAPGANLVLVTANSASLSDLFAAVQTAKHIAGVSVVSMSFGTSGDFSGETAYDSVFTSNAGQNVTFLAAGGDSGVPAGYPATSPNVIAVGGTTLSTDAAGDYLGESGWSGSGGSLSQIETQPTYQQGVVKQSSTRRAAPDVAMNADPNSGVAVYDSFDGSAGGGNWFRVGGTSLATPIWAGLIAIVNQDRVANGLAPYDGRTGTLPRLYALPSADFHDITTGNNGYAAGAGYDLVTGLGTPIASKLVSDLANLSNQSNPTPPTPPVPPTPPPAQTSLSLSASPSPATVGQSIVLSASGGTGLTQVTFYGESNGVSGLQTGRFGDALLGIARRPSASGNWTLTWTGRLSAGTYEFYALGANSNGTLSNVASALETVVPALAPTIASLSASSSTLGLNQTFSLGVSGVSGSVSELDFYVETNGAPGLQTGYAGDQLLGSVYGGSSGTWTLAVNSGVTPGKYTVYAVAFNSSGTPSNVVSTTVTVQATTPALRVANNASRTGARHFALAGARAPDELLQEIEIARYARGLWI